MEGADLKDQVNTAIVTGGSNGIGAAICGAILANGSKVFNLDRQVGEQTHSRLHTREVDLLDPAATREVVAEIAASNQVTQFIHNAGMIRPALLQDVDPADMQDLAQLHLSAPLIILQAMLPTLRASGSGRVVLISSRAAVGMKTRSAYAATKAGMIALGRTWALELARDGVTVNIIAPGPVHGTPLFHQSIAAGSVQEAELAAAIPVGRLGTPSDVANAAMFFLDRKSGFVTGQVLYVCGGASVGSPTF